tara:strand:- start:149 stop:1807 length:1659 start_codon:yes stop_codon:yes gene_type:complete
MKREVFVSALLFAIFLIATNTNAETITGEVTSNNAALTIVVGGTPSLIINKPKNQTYFTNVSLKLDITSNGANVWYNLDNGNNVTLSGDSSTYTTYLNTSEASHTLYAFANSSDGVKTKSNITFSIDTSLFSIDYEEFEGSAKGSSTIFNEYSFEEMQNLTDIILEHISFGKISFLEGVNVTNDAISSDNTININTHIDISSNEIYLNSTALPNFNITATLILYDLSFTTPRILIDGEVCPSTICTQNYYINNDLSFNITHFTTFSAEETPAEEEAAPSAGVSSGGSGSGGGGASSSPTIPTRTDITIIPDSLSIHLIKGQEDTREITITNNRNKQVILNTEIQNLEELIQIPKTISLSPKESKIIRININPIDKGLLTGKILFKVGGKIVKQIPTIINVKSQDFLFDFSVSIAEKSRIIKQGNKLKAQINLLQIGPSRKVDVVATYFIKDFAGNTHLEESETFFVSEEKEFVKEFFTENIPPGEYILGVEITYPGEFATSSVEFKVVPRKLELIQVIIILAIAIIIIIIIGIIIWTLKKERKFYKSLKKKR